MVSIFSQQWQKTPCTCTICTPVLKSNVPTKLSSVSFYSCWSRSRRMPLVFLEKHVVLYTPESIGEMEGQIMYYAVALSFLPCFCVKHEALFFLPFQILEKNWPGRDMAHPVWVYQWLIASSMQGCLGIRLYNNMVLEEVCESAFFLAPSLLSKRENIRLVCFVI